MIKPRLLLAATVAAAGVMTASAAHVSVANERLTFTDTFEQGDIVITFEKCMYNELYTFKNVNLNGKNLNTTSSDNIGPFLINNAIWAGGNHAHPYIGAPNERKTAYTMSVAIRADGELLTGDASVDCSVVEIEVVNQLLYHVNDTPYNFATETMLYRVSGNSIEIWATHKYEYDQTLTVSRYFGMQSMFNYETELLTPGGKMKYWTSFTPGGDANRLEFTKDSAPNFCTFIEHGNDGYQATYMFREGLGNRGRISKYDVVFTGNNNYKSYHKLIGNKSIQKGDETQWHGLYSWFEEPLLDECRDESNPNPSFAYPAYINGRYAEMWLDASGKMTEMTGIVDVVADSDNDFAYALPGRIVISDHAPDACCYSIAGTKLYSGAGEFECPAGVYIVSDNHGHSVKLFVK